MNTKPVRELRSIAKDKGLRGYYKLKKDDLIALLLEQLAEEIPTPPPRARWKERRPVLSVKLIPSPQEMDEFEKEEMKKSRPVVKSSLSELYDQLIDYVRKPIKNAVRESFLRMKNSIMSLYDSAKKALKGYVESEAEKEDQEEEDVGLTPYEHERVLKGAYRSFVIPGKPKTDIDSYFDQTKPHIKTLIENQLKELGSAKIIMTLWIIWKKSIETLIELDPEDLEDAQESDDACTDDHYTRVEVPLTAS